MKWNKWKYNLDVHIFIYTQEPNNKTSIQKKQIIISD